MSRATAPLDEAPLTINGPPAGAAMPVPAAGGAAAAMGVTPGTYAPDGLDQSALSGVDLRTAQEQHMYFCNDCVDNSIC